MRKLVKIFFLVLIVIVVGYFIFSKKNETCTDCETFVEQVKNFVSPKNTEKKLEPLVIAEAKIIDTAQMNEPEFNSWIKNASVDLNNSSIDTKETEDRLRLVSEKLTKLQIDLLIKKSLDVEVAINERILSVYLLTMSSDEQINESLGMIAKTKLPDFGPINVHSEAEVRNTQELAIRYMAIDELARQARTDENALHKLKLLLVEADSIEVRNYVQRKLDEMK